MEKLPRIKNRKPLRQVNYESVKIYVIYTMIFSITALGVYLSFVLAGKSFVWKGDGLSQHYPSMVYYGKYLREILRNFAAGDFSIPLWDFKIGFGSDIPSTLSYYVFGDPLTLFSALIPSAQMDHFYSFLVVLRLYLAGFAFIVYCKVMKREGFASICGAVAYVFCGYTIMAGTRHPFFLNPVLYLPIFLIGIEHIFAKKKPYLFIAITAVSAVSNFYFFYMLCIIIFLYAVWRFFSIYKERRVYNLFISLRNFVGYFMIGLLISCILFLPTVYLFLSGVRSGLSANIPLLYTSGYYTNLFFGIISGKAPGEWTAVAFAPLVLAAIVLMFTKRKKYLDLKIGLLGMAVLLIFPYVSHIMNGFSYVSNRWSFAVALLFALILTTMIPELLKMTRKQFVILLLFAAAYLIGYLIFSNEKGIFWFMWGVLCVSVVLLYLVSYWSRKRNIPKVAVNAVVLIPIMVSLIYYGNSKFSSEYAMSKYMDNHTSYDRILDSSATEVRRVEDTGFYRYDDAGSADKRTGNNTPMVAGVNGMSFYLSLADAPVSQYMLDLTGRYYLSYVYNGLDNRASLDTLANVKYQVTGRQNKNIFYGYEPLSSSLKSGLPMVVYENKYALPFGYTYSGILSKEKYEKLDPVQKQEAMLQGALVESNEEELQEIQPINTSHEVDSKITCGKGVVYKNNTFIVKRKNAIVNVTFQGTKDSETYLLFDEVSYQERKKASENTKNKNWKGKDRGAVTVYNKGLSKSFTITNSFHRAYEGRNKYMVHVGYSKKAKKSIRIKFAEPGTYQVGKLKVLCQPMKQYASQVTALKQDTLENTVFGTNKISGNISLDTKKLLCMTIPYSRGWTAYVDGKRADLLKTNIMYSGIILDAGDHTVELKYFTPGMKAGIICSGIGLLLLTGVMYWERKKRSKKKTAE